METRLVLNIESDLVEMVNDYAQKEGSTLSKLVENYFWVLVKSEKKKEINLTGSLATILLGSLKAPDGADYKEELANSLANKYL